MTNGTSKPAIDTPADGDFASYVERLAAATPPPAAQQATPATEQPQQQQQQPSLRAILEPLLPLQGLVMPARQVVLVLIALQAVALFVFYSGSFMNLLTLAIIWWALGRLALELERLSPGGTNAAIDPNAVREGMQRLVKQLKALQKK